MIVTVARIAKKASARRGEAVACGTESGRCAMSFEGWPPEAISFYKGLEADNSKAYWTANRDVFEDAVRGPMEALVVELEPRYGEGRLMRPYRDIRFSKDKTPYKTHCAAMIGIGYVSLSAHGLGVGCGYYHMAPDQLDRYRTAVDDAKTGEALAGIVAAIRAADTDVTPTDPLKTAPRGYPADHPRLELLRGKGLVAWKRWPPARWLATSAAKQRVIDAIDTATPLREWLTANVGPTTEPPRRRP
jgi:uncharacterized protein (TIGR02453 family)